MDHYKDRITQFSEEDGGDRNTNSETSKSTSSLVERQHDKRADRLGQQTGPGIDSGSDRPVGNRFSIDQNLPTILEDRSGERSGTDRLSSSANLASARDGNSMQPHLNNSPLKRLNMSMFFDELASRLQAEIKTQYSFLSSSSASQKLKKFASSKEEAVNHQINTEISSVEMYIADIFNVKLSDDEPLILDMFLATPTQVYTTNSAPPKQLNHVGPVQTINLLEKSSKIKDEILFEVRRMKDLKFNHIIQAFESHVESRSVECLEKALNPKRISTRSKPSIPSGKEDGLAGPGFGEHRPKSKTHLISRLVESFESKTMEDTEHLNLMDSKLTEVMDRIDRL